MPGSADPMSQMGLSAAEMETVSEVWWHVTLRENRDKRERANRGAPPSARENDWTSASLLSSEVPEQVRGQDRGNQSRGGRSTPSPKKGP